MRNPESPDETIEVGDRIYAMTLCPSPTIAEIRASQTASQRLAEVFAANSQPKPSRSIVPHHLHDFKDIFSKASFDSLPEPKQWVHAIELIPDAEPSSCKVYPLAPHEQDELDAFLQENLSSGRMRPSKSPMASPVFFINKKNGSLHLVQDYQVLNAMMQWKSAQQVAFDALKQAVISKPVLVFPDDDSSFRVEVDSSDFATGAVLSQQSKGDGKWHPVTFYSKSLNAVEWNYKIHDKEMLAIIQSFEEWQHFLVSAWHKFEVWTDHKNLEYFCTAKKLN
ncbi:hypothetical protein E4T56_gene19017 [Termitomyces sp. T112]|nr:hypothetical protein E4T56_gene19017 [Termitomyces sp. T112]